MTIPPPRKVSSIKMSKEVASLNKSPFESSGYLKSERLRCEGKKMQRNIPEQHAALNNIIKNMCQDISHDFSF